MKKFLLFALVLAAISCPASAYAEDNKFLFQKGIALKIDYLNFTDGFIRSNNIDKSVYVGVEGYAHVAPEIYLGLETGIANPSGAAGSHRTELTYVPIELNAKYVGEFLPELNLGVGGGLSFNYASETVVSGNNAFSNSDWLLGGQAFAELLFASGNYFAGVNFKYQFTDNFSGPVDVPSHRFSNWRLGGFAGAFF